MPTGENDPPVVFKRGSKYRNSMKTLLPYRRSRKTGHPVDNASFFSTVLFSWLTKLVLKLYRKPVSIHELWDAPKDDKADPNCNRLLRMWDEEKKKNKSEASLKRAFYKTIRTRVITSCICAIIFTLCQFTSNGIVVRYLIVHVESSDPSWKIGAALVSAMFVFELSRLFAFALMFAITLRSAVRSRAGVLLAVFQKVLQIHPNRSSSIGEVINMCSSDGDRIFEAVYLLPLLFSGPVMFISGTIYLCTVVGPLALTGCSVFIIITVIQVGLVKLLQFMRAKAVRYTDQRLNRINEVLSSMKLIKMYAWEESFQKAIGRIRDKEHNVLRWAMFLQSMNVSLANLTPYLATVLSLSCIVLMGDNITTSDAFTCLTMYNVMSFSLKVSPVVLKNLGEARVALDRVEKILNGDEYTHYLVSNFTSPNLAIEMINASLRWPKQKKKQTDKSNNHSEKENLIIQVDPVDSSTDDERRDSKEDSACLSNITIAVDTGSLIGVCGRVGCGKSSLISGMLGQMELLEGSVAVRGTNAYCAQQAWIMNATIRENITFGLPYNEEKYNRIVEICCLLPDFEVLGSGDLTEVGERGVNLSGGQKQRINLARAVYMDMDTYLLDDPLSAVDAHVGKKLFENVVLELKKKQKTIVLVTHRLEYLPHCDNIILIKDGKVWEYGTHEDLLDRGEEYYQMYKMWSKQSKDQSEKRIDGDSEADDSKVKHIIEDKEQLENRLKKGKLMKEEDTAQGAISPGTYYMYIKAAGGVVVSIFCFFVFVVYVCCLQFSTIWLTLWLKQGSGLDNSALTETSIVTNKSEADNITFDLTTEEPYNMTSYPGPVEQRVVDNPRLHFYLSVFGYAFAATVVVMILKSYIFVTLTLRASHRLHSMLFDRILHGTMEFFDTTPTGRILNRFQKDQDMLDNVVPFLFDLVLSYMAFLLTCVVFIAYVFPYFLAVIAVIAPLFLFAFFMFKAASREMRRQDNLTRSPWISHIATTITGIPTIRAYEKTKAFITKFSDLLDTNTVPFFLYSSVNRWLVTRLDFMTMIIVILCSLLTVLTLNIVPAAFAGLAISSALMMTTIFQFTVRISVEAESNFVSAERIVQYIKTVPLEKTILGNEDIGPKWPEFGSVQFQNVDMRYREGMPLVLKDISFTINTAEKIGIIGRTGSGKSSLGVALFRLADLAGGIITIDGVDISEISLRQLRSKLSIIPQEPVLFTGTVRYNVDPFLEYTNDEVWKALEHTYMKEIISQLPEKLESHVRENGGNFSMGERQLLCLARALLRRNKILLLDEVTASIDTKTDHMVQATIKEHFADCTVITIAHRLHTVMESERIIVLDKGILVEFDTPAVLSANPDSILSKLLSSTMK